MRVRNRWMAAVVVATAMMAGCEKNEAPSAPTGPTPQESQLQRELQQLKVENLTLKNQAFKADQKAALAQEEPSKLRADLEKLRSDYEQLQKSYEAMAANLPSDTTETSPEDETSTEGAVASADEGPDPQMSAGTETPRAEQLRELQARQEEIEKKVADIKGTIAAGRTEISTLAGATIDKKAEVPPGGMIDGGLVYRRDTSRPNGYYFVPIGPAVIRGDYRSAYAKSAAIDAARSRLTPLYVELKSLEKELGAVKAKIVALKKSDE